MKDEQIIDRAGKLISQWKNGSLKVGTKYKFQYYKFINIAYLYLHGVDGANPDLMDNANPHNFVPDFIDSVTKVNEQTRIDFKELGFSVDGQKELAKFIVKAANIKNLTKNNDWTEIMERVTDDANWYGSGYKMIYTNSKKVQVHKHLCPWDIVWDLHDFDKSPKILVMNRTVKSIVENKRYKQSARAVLRDSYKGEEMEKRIDIQQYTDGENLYILDVLHKIVLMKSKQPKGLAFIKYDHEVRRGFNDAPGRGMCEKALNVIIQNKVSRERYNQVEDIVTKMIFAKATDGADDKVQGKTMQELETGLILEVGSAENLPQPIDMGGAAQLTELQNKIASTSAMFDKIFQTPEVLNGEAKTLGASASGVMVSLLSENATSVHKDVKKRYARKAEKEYRDYILPYTMKAFSSEDNIKKYLSPTEWNVVKRHIIDYELAVKQADLLGEGVDPAEVPLMLADYEKQLRDNLETKKLITKDILKALQEDVKGIDINISAEKTSMHVLNEFYDGIKADYMANPQVLADQKYIALIKRSGKTRGIDELTITEFLNDMQ